MGLLNPCFVPRGWFLYTMIVPGGGFLLASSRVPGVRLGGRGWLWMKLIPALSFVISSVAPTRSYAYLITKIGNSISLTTVFCFKIWRVCLNNQTVLFINFLIIFDWYLCDKYMESNCNVKFSCQTFLDRL